MDSLEWQRATSNNGGVSQRMGSRNWCIPIFPFQSLSEKFERHSITFSENIGKTEPLVSTVVINFITYAYTDFSSSVTLSPPPHSKFPLPAHKMLTQAVLLERTQAKW